MIWHQRALVILGLTCALAAVGCSRRKVVEAPSAGPLRTSDQAWEERARLGLGPSRDALYEAFALEPKNPEVLWRIARLRIAEGLVEDDPRSRSSAFAEARAVGMQCLEGSPRFRQTEQTDLRLAITVLPSNRHKCAAWLGFSWARWMVAHGAEASELDRDTLTQILEPLRGHADVEVSSLATWATGLSDAALPVWLAEGRNDEGVLMLLAIAEQRPDDLLLRVDLLNWMPKDHPDQKQLLDEVRKMRASGPGAEAARRRLLDSAP